MIQASYSRQLPCPLGSAMINNRTVDRMSYVYPPTQRLYAELNYIVRLINGISIVTKHTQLRQVGPIASR